eukprot:SAG11_NODE_1480_length_4835_cov_3.840794_4_plen_58_part_00
MILRKIETFIHSFHQTQKEQHNTYADNPSPTDRCRAGHTTQPADFKLSLGAINWSPH